MGEHQTGKIFCYIKHIFCSGCFAMWRHSNKQQKIIDYPSREAKMWKSFFFLHFVNRMWSSRVREFFFCGTSRHREQRKNQIGKTCSQPFFKSFWTTFAIFIFNRSFFLIFQWFRRVVCWALNQWQHLRVEHLVPHPPKIVQNHFFAISNNFCGKRFFSFDKKSKWQKNYFVLVWWKKKSIEKFPQLPPECTKLSMFHSFTAHTEAKEMIS